MVEYFAFFVCLVFFDGSITYMLLQRQSVYDVIARVYMEDGDLFYSADNMWHLSPHSYSLLYLYRFQNPAWALPLLFNHTTKCVVLVLSEGYLIFLVTLDRWLY